MKKFVAGSPQTEITGYTLLSLKESVTADQYLHILERYNIAADPTPNDWYAFQPVLDFCRELCQDESTSLSHMMAIGRKGAETDLMPENIKDIPSALKNISETYELNMRHIGEPDGYQVEQLGDRHIRMIDFTPWPHDMVYGYLYGLAVRFRTPNCHPVVRRTYLNETHPDDDGAIYEITW